ncbi:MAG: hypothetical protein WCP36_09770, partial [Methanomicrobiales archaeon]
VIDFEISQMVPSYQLKAQPSLVPPHPEIRSPVISCASRLPGDPSCRQSRRRWKSFSKRQGVLRL